MSSIEIKGNLILYVKSKMIGSKSIRRARGTGAVMPKIVAKWLSRVIDYSYLKCAGNQWHSPALVAGQLRNGVKHQNIEKYHRAEMRNGNY